MGEGGRRSAGPAPNPGTAHLPRSAMPGARFSPAPLPTPPRPAARPGTSWGSRGNACPACVAVGVAGSRKSSSASELDMAPSWRRLSGSRPVTTTIPLALGSGRGFGRAEAAAPGTPYRLAAPGMTRPAAGGPEGAERQCAGGRAAAQSTPTRLRPAAGLTPPPPATGRRRSDSAMTGRKLAQSKSRQRQRPAPEWSLGGGLRACRALIGPLASGRALSGRPGGGGPLRSHNWASACSVRTVPADVRVDP